MALRHAISPSEPNLIPRREFIRDNHVQSSFAILALSATALVRLYSFPPNVVVAVRRLLDETRMITTCREDVTNNFSEFAIDGKPWNTPKSLHTEKLLIDLFSVLYRNGHEFLSTLDYGREQDDRVIMAFARPGGPTAQSPAGSSSALHRTSQASVQALSKVKVPFAISFPNTNILRVISPPLHSTPAILQTVRGSWPRGVVAEKKVGENVYEFKLKGYKWFQEDTFATDSLRHVLALLSALDGFGFTLLTSLSMTGRSRVKDLWIFTGPSQMAMPESPPASPIHAHNDLTRATPEKPGEHKRNHTAPGKGSPPHVDEHGQVSGHPRAATDGDVHNHRDDPTARFSSSKPAILRKPAPRAQLPVSVASSTGSNEHQHEEGPAPLSSPELVRVTMASTVGSAVNMTGVGIRKLQQEIARQSLDAITPPQPSPAVFYATAPPTQNNPYFPPTNASAPIDSVSVPEASASSPAPQSSSSEERATHRPLSPSSRTKASPPHTNRTNAPPPAMGNISPSQKSDIPTKPSGTPTPPLLGPSVFRDSAFSSQTSEIPITWTGPSQEKESGAPPVKTPVLPGGWVSPVEERDEPKPTLHLADGRARPYDTPPDLRAPHDQITPERQEIRTAEPELVHPQPHVARRSEAAVLEQMPRPAKDRTKRPTPDRKQSHDSAKGKGDKARMTTTAGEGWVLVNVGSPAAPSGASPKVIMAPAPVSPAQSPRAKDGSNSSPSRRPPHSRNPPSSNSLRSPKSPTPATAAKPAPNGSSMSPAAKAIVIIDAMETKRTAAEKDASDPPSSGLRRLFSLNSGSPKQPPPPGPAPLKDRKAKTIATAGGVQKTKTIEQEERDAKKGASRWRRKGPSTVSKSSQRISVD
ncbi:hypothetical protein FA95DRAFT_1568639 [Auriscalpium vulgare]|uniref:Uncharacterized protein n=1 Tax=Auriscalpium vulgare TaxID=40419 RepID=A0ACB8SAU4_9AGAM|nr:hypothetical protein FA95DRAFT_1568639 [Auriscalpium vulgare]